VKLKDRFRARRRRKARERYEQERARQEALREQDAQDAVKGVVGGAGPVQGGYPT
jgi:hypothetical protein